MLVQLRQSGMLSGVRGVVFGRMPDCGEPGEICQTIVDCLGDLDVPIAYGAPLGHGEVNFAVPLGVRVRMHVERSDGTDVGAAGALEGIDAAVS